MPACDWDLRLRTAQITRFHYDDLHIGYLCRRRPATASSLRGPNTTRPYCALFARLWLDAIRISRRPTAARWADGVRRRCQYIWDRSLRFP